MTCHTSTGSWHVTNSIKCIGCEHCFCLSCFRGCPHCGIGKGMERRFEKRLKVDWDIEIWKTL